MEVLLYTQITAACLTKVARETEVVDVYKRLIYLELIKYKTKSSDNYKRKYVTYRTATQHYLSLCDSYPSIEAGRWKALFISERLVLIGRWGFQRCHRMELWSLGTYTS